MTRMKRLAAVNKGAVERLAGIERAMTVLGNEDILDLADITRLVRAEMAKRSISL